MSDIQKLVDAEMAAYYEGEYMDHSTARARLLDLAHAAIATHQSADALDAARWRRALACARMANHGGFVIFPDEPTGLSDESIVKVALAREIDAAMARESAESGGAR